MGSSPAVRRAAARPFEHVLADYGQGGEGPLAGSVRSDETTDEELVARAIGGDETAYGKLVTRYSNYVYTIAVRIVGNESDAEDVAQEAFVRAYRALPRFRGDSKFSSWLYRIAANRALTHLKRRRRRVAAVDIGAGPHVEAEASQVDCRDSDRPDHAVMDSEFRSRVRAAVAELPEQYRVVVTLFYLEERSYKEVAETLGIPMGTLKTHLHRARFLLREILTASNSEGGR
jgi:RNA polymerase sigma-70 factor, ECF subfamily